MARSSGRGFRSPKNYDPRRGKKGADRRGATTRTTQKARSNHRPDVTPMRATRVFEAHEPGGVSFAELGVGDNLTRTLTELGIRTPFPIQAVTIPEIIAGKHLLGRAQTGSGKTLAFAIGIIERIMKLKAEGAFGAAPVKQTLRRGTSARGSAKPAEVRAPKALILAPTRELALQIDATVQPLARALGLFTTQLVGGVPKAPQQHALRRGIDIVIGTPGRVQDLLNREQLDLRQVAVCVLDEADHMSEMGFIEPVLSIMKRLKRGVQTLLYSATLDDQVRELVTRFMPGHVSHEVALRDQAAIKHLVFLVFYEEKIPVLVELLRGQSRALVFVRTKAYAAMLADEFAKQGLKVTTLHGDLSQERRLLNLEKFKRGNARVLVATDVAARGIHIDDVDFVLQADPPDDSKAYLHRAGRTGRAGATGVVATVIPRTRQKRTRELLREAGVTVAYFDEARAGKADKLLKGLKKQS